MIQTDKNLSGYGQTQRMIGDGASPAQIAKLSAWILDIADAADGELASLDIDEEMKTGILHITSKLREGFNLSNLNYEFSNYFPALPQSIGSLRTFLKLMQLEHDHQPELASDLLSEIEDVLSGVAFAALDPRIAEIARRHLRLLTIMLNHLDAFGVEAAMIAYSELIVRLQQAARDAAPAEREKAKGVIERMSKWWERLKTLNEAYETGTKLIENASEAVDLLGFN